MSEPVQQKLLETDEFGPVVGAQMTDVDPVRAFILGGHAIFTLVSRKTGRRFTYKLTRGKGQYRSLTYVAVLGGPNNTEDFRYAGILLQVPRLEARLTRKSKATDTTPYWVAFKWLVQALNGQSKFDQCEFWHEGRCAACGRRLTDPESIREGWGPVCIQGRYR